MESIVLCRASPPVRASVFFANAIRRFRDHSPPTGNHFVDDQIVVGLGKAIREHQKDGAPLSTLHRHFVDHDSTFEPTSIGYARTTQSLNMTGDDWRPSDISRPKFEHACTGGSDTAEGCFQEQFEDDSCEAVRGPGSVPRSEGKLKKHCVTRDQPGRMLTIC